MNDRSHKDLTEEEIRQLSRYDEAVRMAVPEHASGYAWTLLDIAKAMEEKDMEDILYHLGLLIHQIRRIFR